MPASSNGARAPASSCGGGEEAERGRGEGWKQGARHVRMQAVPEGHVFHRLLRQTAPLMYETGKTMRGKEEVYERPLLLKTECGSERRF